MSRARRPLHALAAAAVVAAFASCTHGPPARGPEPEPTPTEELDEGPAVVAGGVEAAPADLLGGAAYDLPVEANSWVEAELNFLVGQRRAVIERWIVRGDPYEAHIKQVLREEGVPTDLYHLAMIESGFSPTARSRVGAVGLWQFMPATGRGMGLRIDDLVDERMDPVRSTRAAARHLRSLHGIFHDWALAAAAYNAGSGRISRAMKSYGATDFWDLAVRGNLAEETKHYVPRLYAMTIITKGRERFGLAPRGVAGELALDSLTLDLPIPLAELARLGPVSEEALARLNPHLVRRMVPAGYRLWTPAGSAPGLQSAYLASEYRRFGGYGSYAVRRGDELGRLAERSGLPMERIREMNPGVAWDDLKVGQKLRFPATLAPEMVARAEAAEKEARREATRLAAAEEAERRSRKKGDAEDEEAAASAKKPSKKGKKGAGGKGEARAEGKLAGVEHEVQPGETLWSIARQHDVTVERLSEANGLDGATIRPGQTLRVPASAGKRAAAGAAEKSAERGGKSGKKAASQTREHVVRPGETLWSIAREYGATVDSIQQANRITGSAVIVPGQKLRIPRG